MPAKPKYTAEQRKKVADLWKIGRIGRYERGEYTLIEIEKLTGVNKGTCWMIATGKR